MQQPQEGFEIPLRRGYRSQVVPYGEAGQRIVNVGLHKQTLSLGHLDDCRQAGLIAGASLSFCSARSLELDRSVGSHLPRSFQGGFCLGQLACQVLNGLVVSGGFRALA